MLFVVKLFRFCPNILLTRDMLYDSILMLLGSIFDADQVDAPENISNNGCRFFFYFFGTVLRSVDETGVLEIYKYTNLMETNDFFTSQISILPVIIITLTKTFCLFRYSLFFKTQDFFNYIYIEFLYKDTNDIYLLKISKWPYLIRTLFVSLAGCLKLRNV